MIKHMHDIKKHNKELKLALGTIVTLSGGITELRIKTGRFCGLGIG